MVGEEKDTRNVWPFNSARKRFDEILCQVERGETVLITRGGRVVAQFSPPAEDQCELTEAGAWVQRFLEERETWPPTNVTREEILAWRHEGHRW